MLLYDVSKIRSERIKTDEGFLHVPAYIARVGVQVYDAAYDFKSGALPANIDQKPGVEVKLLRPAKEVFGEGTLVSYANRPVTDGHPNEGEVTADNVRALQVGFSRDSVEMDGEAVKAQLVIQAKDAIAKIENENVTQISAGYSTDILWGAGVDEKYGAYDGIQTNIRCNHIALVRNGRAGPDVRLADSTKNKGDVRMTTRIVDGFTIEVTDQAGEAIDKLQTELKVACTLAEEAETKLSDSKKEVEKLRGELDAERAKTSSLEDIDRLVDNRLALFDHARKLYPEIKVEGKSDRDVRIEAVAKVNDGFDFAGKSDEYVEAVFETLVKSHRTNDLGDDLQHLNDGAVNLLDRARSEFVKARRAMQGA